MPCDQVIRSTVEFLPTATNPDLLKTGLVEAGYNVVTRTDGVLAVVKGFQTGFYYPKTGKLELPVNWDSQEFKRAYSGAVVNAQAKKLGWQVEWSTNQAGNKVAKVQRRK